MALENLEFKRPKLVSFGRGGNRREREGRAKEEEEKRKKESQAKKGMELWIFGMETHLDYESYEI